MRITPEEITSIKEDEVFVFGSNLAGIHGAGAAKQAIQWGAGMTCGRGLRGYTYALPTKDRNIETLPVNIIKFYVNELIQFMRNHPQKKFLVTKVGCGLAGLTPEDIAPLFRGAVDLPNVWLPESFLNILNPD
jgi:hypothetical protein